ncbi:MAG: hypothetical protein ABSC60_16735 [Acidobacteriota bacterium]
MLKFCRTQMGLWALVSLFGLFSPAFSPAQVTWVKNFDDALKQAGKEKKFIVLDISASW